ncbi:hypothetical protein [Candidatus Harpocratesius sp.]
MNKYGVALAADSAATIGSKVRNTSLKLHMLSRQFPVGIMIYGSNSIFGYPISLFIKEFQLKSRKKPLNMLENYANEFIEFLETKIELHDESDFEDQLKTYFILNAETLVNEAISNTDRELERSSKFYYKKLIENLKNIIGSLESELEESEYYYNGTDEILTKIKIEGSKISQIIKEIFEKELKIPQNLIKKTIDLIYLSIIKKNEFFLANSSGFVIAGYGKNDYFPVAYEFYINFWYKDCIFYSKGEPQKISTKNPVKVMSFAQNDMINSFLEGIHPIIRYLLLNLIENDLDQFFKKVQNSLKKKIDSKDLNKIKTLIKDTKDEIQQECNEIGEIYKNQALYPGLIHCAKDELATIAETLVSLTSFHRKISLHPETVGGPTDVAVITKEDGFIWIKRKFYFNKDHNLDYLRRVNNIK